MAQTNTSNTRDSEIHNVGRDQVSTRDVYHINHYHLAFYNSGPATVTPATDGSSSADTGNQGLEETRARVEDSEGIVVTGSLTRKLWLRVCRLLCLR
ncbi:hypothetical protein FIBSPDRAFT_873995 [Athelia psychrophila]|uniref:Uncharacterized protein n=1 Tax=Athelia psychrophila TaxID=1759441 RepID=A0A165XYT4_9AGAM|nr:hypothetical protein FIBSPDRAFT_873995 [Fibularhizoctonia sp. CBS 109695]